MRKFCAVIALLVVLLLASSTRESAHAYLLLYMPGGGGVPCGATQYVLDTTCNSVLAGSTPL